MHRLRLFGVVIACAWLASSFVQNGTPLVCSAYGVAPDPLKSPPPLKTRRCPRGSCAHVGMWRNARQTISSVALSRDERLAAIAYDTEVWLVDIKTGRRFPQAIRTNLAKSMAFSADGKMLIITNCLGGKEITAYDVATGKRLRQFPPPKFLDPDGSGQTAVSPDGKTLACSLGGAIRFFDLATARKRPQPAVRGTGWVRWICYSADGKLIAGGTRSPKAGVCMWDAATSRLLRTFAAPKDDRVICCALTPDGRLLASQLSRSESFAFRA